MADTTTLLPTEVLAIFQRSCKKRPLALKVLAVEVGVRSATEEAVDVVATFSRGEVYGGLQLLAERGPNGTALTWASDGNARGRVAASSLQKHIEKAIAEAG